MSTNILPLMQPNEVTARKTKQYKNGRLPSAYKRSTKNSSTVKLLKRAIQVYNNKNIDLATNKHKYSDKITQYIISNTHRSPNNIRPLSESQIKRKKIRRHSYSKDGSGTGGSLACNFPDFAYRNVIDLETPVTQTGRNDVQMFDEDFTFIAPPTMGEWLNTAETIHRKSREELNVVDF